MKVLSMKDRIRLNYKTSEGDVSITIKPLKYSEKVEINSLQRNVAGELIDDYMAQTYLSLKYSIVNVEGLKKYDGSDYALEFDQVTGELSEDSVEDLVPALQSLNCLTHTFFAANKMIENLEGVDFQIIPKR
jgi:hypothetical protein